MPGISRSRKLSGTSTSLSGEIKSRSDLFRDVHKIRGSRGGEVETSEGPRDARLFNFPNAFDLSSPTGEDLRV